MSERNMNRYLTCVNQRSELTDMMTDSMMKNMKMFWIQIENRYNLFERKRKSSSEGEYRVQTGSSTEWLNLGKEVL